MKDIYCYAAILEKGKEGGYGVYFPDLPGCVSGGDTMEEAMRDAKEALLLHLYGMEEDGEKFPRRLRLIRLRMRKMNLFFGRSQLQTL